MIDTVDLYYSLGLDEFFCGDSFEIDFKENTLNTDLDIFDYLDKICLIKKLKPLKNKWEIIDYKECDKLLLKALNFDLAYTACEIMPYEKAFHFHKLLTDKINKAECRCFTNWSKNPWEPSKNGYGWESLTESTFDMGIVFVDSSKLLFTYFVSED